MSKIQKNLIAAFFVLWLLSLAAAEAKAQDIPSYLFLEVVDSNEKPIPDAFVRLTKPDEFGVLFTEENVKPIRTYSDGTVGFEPFVCSDFFHSLFKISKPGYFDFFDFGVVMRRRNRKRIKIELLKVPETKAGQKILGKEQQKREFLWAVKRGDAESVRQFLRKGLSANLSTSDLRGVSEPQNVSAVLFAAGARDGRMVKILLDAGAKIRSDLEPQRSILGYYLMGYPADCHRSLTGHEIKGSVEEYREGVKRLFKAGTATNDLFGAKGLTALMIAARENDAENVELLIKLGIPVNYNIGGYTALMNAVGEYGHNRAGYSPVKVVEVLLKAGADPNIAFNPAGEVNCWSALMQSVFGGDLETVRLLIKYKADVNFRCKNGDTALRWSKRYSVVSDKNQQAMIRLLEAAGAKE